MKMYKKIVFFDDLSEQAKDKAREWYKDGNGLEFLGEYLENFISEKLNAEGFTVDNIEVFYSLSNSQGDGVSFTATLSRGLMTYEVNRNDSRYSHEMTISEVYYENESGEVIDQPELLEKMRSIARQAEKAGYKYIEDEDKDGNVDENIRSNEYTFSIKGERMDADNN